MSATSTLPENCHAIVELFGHQRIAGRISEQVLGGTSFVRIDVPAVNGSAGFTKLFGNGAIYAVNFVDEEIATLAAKGIRAEPIGYWEAEELKKSLREKFATATPIESRRSGEDGEDDFPL